MNIFIVLLLGLIAITGGNETRSCCGVGLDPGCLTEECSCEEFAPGYFYYFAYGSNLLPSRMRINCPSAKNCSAATLDGWRLDFNSLPELHRWNGAVATIVEDENATVIGNVWLISDEESDKIDKQEGVLNHYYKKENVTVRLHTGGTVTARAYIMTNQPPKVEPEEIPPERQPSRTYLQVILFGAIKCRIAVVHIEYINRFRHNHRIAPNETRKALGYPFYDDTFP